VTEFEEELWYITVDRVEVHPDRRLSFIFRDGAAVLEVRLAGMMQSKRCPFICKHATKRIYTDSVKTDTRQKPPGIVNYDCCRKSVFI